MYYFIPSWYSGERQWSVEAPLWFRVFESMSFDDSINQMKMFQDFKEESAFILLCYQPQLRYFLHKQDLLNSKYWSFFDDIQNIHREDTRTIQFKELGWPHGVNFTYTPFMVIARLGNKHLADIHFAEDGNLLRIHFLEEGRDVKQFFFDDRGFLSSIKYFSNGVASHQDYLNEFGVWQVREYLSEEQHRIEIHSEADKSFRKKFYDSWEELFRERLTVFKQKVLLPSDTLVIAADHRHNDLMIERFSGYRKIFSFFGYRFDLTDTSALKRVLEDASLVVTDSEATEVALLDEINKHSLGVRNVTRVTPFDTRLRLGKSQTVKELLIYFLIDGIEESVYRTAISILLNVMAANPLIELHVVTYEPNHHLDRLSEEVLEEIRQHHSLERFTSVSEGVGENNLEEDEKLELTAITFSAFTNESQIIKELDLTRIVIDLSLTPHLYTQIASISAGIPQINSISTEYVTHGENGWIVKDVTEIGEAIEFYFDGLSNWNRSLVYAVQKMGDYTGGRIIAKWKELLEDRQ
ncbi:accessory Sec system protein Asp1 [Streptococcus suis]|uniref:accessory Sec system protein Asp1 n=1 Tax=Streptococcus suis TaxID=1307 RepID=UPI0038B715DB